MNRFVILAGIIGLVGLTQPVLADKLSDLREEVKTIQEKVQTLEADKITEHRGLKLRLDGFTDISFTAKKTGDKNTNTFGLGQFDLFMTSKLSDNVSFLSEIVFEFDNNEAALDLERVELKYDLTKWFAIKFGRMHTSLGYWNTEYHHSTWLHTSALRPLLYNWEDNNGIMPVHIVGIELSGKQALGPLDLKYVFNVGNGRGKRSDEIQNIEDGNDTKAINLLVGIIPDFMPGLEFGFNIYTDDIPADDSTEGIAAGRNGKIDELILGGYFVYLGNGIEFLGEISNINHDDSVGQQEYDTLGFYLQGSYRINDFTPYYRFDRINFENGGLCGDPYYADYEYKYDYTTNPVSVSSSCTPRDDITKHSIGLRWDVNTWHALKLEYSYSDRKQSMDNTHAVTANASFRF